MAAAYVVGWTFYLGHKLAPVTSVPGAKLRATAFALVPVAQTRAIDVGGYAVFSLPSTVKGEIVRAGNSGFICVGPDSETSPLRSASITVCPPRFERDADTRFLLSDHRRVFGALVRSYFDWECAALSTKPFSALEIWRQGKKESVRRTLMLAVKSTRLGRALSFSIGRADNISFVVVTEPRLALLSVEDLRAGV